MPPVLSPAQGALQFQFLAEIAVGATARVDLCRAIGGARDGELLAVKRLHPHIAEDPGFATQFLDEVWMTASLKHPNVVEVRGWGSDAQGSYLAVELVQGVSLSRLMKTVFDTGEVFSERMVVYIASRLCRGLAVAHGLRADNGELLHLVHRDLTPGNVLIGFNGDVKVADFGLAKAKQRLTKTLTGLLKGQPTYMAPEQARAQDIDRRADLFSIGVMMYELFAGRRPWLASSDFEMVQLTAKEPPTDLRELRPKIDKELVAIVVRCLEKDPNARFQSAEEVRDRLEGWLELHGYTEGNEEALARFVRRNAMRQMRWFERAVAGELAPAESIRSTRVKPPAPAPSYTSSPARPLTKLKAAPRRAPDGEATDVTDAEAKLAAQLQAPVIREAASEGEEDWAEEVPTLVQKDGNKGAAIVDEESENRTTAVKRHKKLVIADPDSEEVPTIPVKGFAPKAPPIRPRAPAPRPALGTAIEAPVVPRPAAPVANGAAVAHAQGAPSNEPFRPAQPTEASAISSNGATQPDRPQQARSFTPPPANPPRDAPGGPLTEELLLQEADRLAIEAVRRNEEAKVASQRAERKAQMAKLASDAALIAAEAVRLAAVHGLQAAAQRLDEARALEALIARGVFPETASASSMPGASSPSQPPSLSGAVPAVSALSPVPAYYAAGGLAPSQPPHPIPALPPSMPPAMMPPSMPPSLIESPSGFDAQGFRAKLKPALLSTPGLAIVLAVGAFALVLLLLWLLFG